MQDFAFCMKTENNQDDEATLPWFANILNFDWASRDPHKIKSQGSVESKTNLDVGYPTQLMNLMNLYVSAIIPDFLQYFI